MSSDKPDFNIDNYTVEDILTIFKINSPMTKNQIMNIGDTFIKYYRDLNKLDYVEFFSKALNRLLSNYSIVEGFLGEEEDEEDEQEEEDKQEEDDEEDEQEEDDEEEQEKEKEEEVLEEQETDDNNRDIFINPELNIKPINNFQPTYIRDNMNPTIQNVYTSWVNVDSQYREILPKGVESTSTIHSACVSDVKTSNKINQRDSSTDFTFSLATPITNVLAMTIGTIEVPMGGYYTFSDKYGNTSFSVDGAPIKIPEGNYTDEQLKTTLNNKLSPHRISFAISPINQKAYFYHNSSPSVVKTFKWTDTSNSTGCILNKKLNSTLGWMLGFRESQSQTLVNSLTDLSNILQDSTLTDSSYNGVVGSTIVNLKGTKYLILEIDDFNYNRNTGEMGSMSLPASRGGIELPNYIKNISQIYPICDTSPEDPLKNSQAFASYGTTDATYLFDGKRTKTNLERFNRPSRKGDAPGSQTGVIGHDTLTSAQKYTATEIRHSQRKKQINQYFSPQTSNILYRFPVDISKQNPQEPLIEKNTGGLNIARRYFGPVTIEKIKVRLLDDKGNPIDLNNADISFSLLLERLYKY